MGVQLTDEQYGAAMHALQKIATGHHAVSGIVKRMTNEEMRLAAREVCDMWHIPYGIKRTLGRYQADVARLEEEQK